MSECAFQQGLQMFAQVCAFFEQPPCLRQCRLACRLSGRLGRWQPNGRIAALEAWFFRFSSRAVSLPCRLFQAGDRLGVPAFGRAFSRPFGHGRRLEIAAAAAQNLASQPFRGLRMQTFEEPEGAVPVLLFGRDAGLQD
ncbi:MAG: hypothetical protein D6811_07820, partial [Alphaproteobacteria bacterium]